MIRSVRARSATLIVLTGVLLGLSFQGSRGLYETTEGRYAEVGREMLEGGSWLRPTLGHRAHWTKPPLVYWTIAGGIALLGRNPWGVRLANGLLLPLTALGVAWVGGLLWDAETGEVAGLVHASSLFPVVAASTVSTDLLLATWEVWAMGAWWAALRADGARERRAWIVVFWTLLGLAFLTKGPPGLLPLLPIVAWGRLARSRDWPRAALRSPTGMLAFAVVGLSWYVWAVLTTPGLLSYFLGQEVVARVATDHFGRNPEWWKPPVVFGLPLGLGLGAWWAWRPRAAVAALTDEVRGGLSPEMAFLLLWLILPLGVLSLSRSRLPLYVLPFFPPLVLAFARGQVKAGDAFRGLRPWLAVDLVLLLALKVGAAVLPSDKDTAPLAAAVQRADADRVVLLGTPPLYGLQFYLDVPVERVTEERMGSLFRVPPARQTHACGTPSRTVVLAKRGQSLTQLASPAGARCEASALRLPGPLVGTTLSCCSE